MTQRTAAQELAEAEALLEQHPNHLWLFEYVRILRQSAAGEEQQ